MTGHACRATEASDSCWQRGLRLLLGCAMVWFALMAADLALLERELARVRPAGGGESTAVVVGPLTARLRGGRFAVGEDISARQEPNPPEGELARGIARYRGQLVGLVTGRRVGGVAYLDMTGVARVLGGELQHAAPDAPLTLLCPVGVLEVTPGSTSARRNFQRVTLPQAPRLLEGEVHLPVQALQELAQAQVSWDENKRRFRIRCGEAQVEAVMLEDMFDLEIDRSARTLQIRYLGHHLATWSVCVGAGNNTPVGVFHIQNKARWAGWRAYWGEYIPGGSRRNPLGARWLGTTARGRETGRVIGIHGTNQPSSIGRRISGGCIRLTNAHAIELYDTIPLGTRVVIHE